MKSIFILLILSLSVVSCSDDDNYTLAEELSNTWVLQNAICYCGYPENYDFTQTTFTIDAKQETISINNTGSVNSLAETGTYSLKSEGNSILIFNNDRKYTYKIEGNQLLLIYVNNSFLADVDVTYVLKAK